MRSSNTAPAAPAAADLPPSPPPTKPPKRPPGRLRRWGAVVRRRADLRIIIPVAIMLALLGYVASVAAAGNNGQFALAVERTWWIVLLLTFPYFVARATAWRELLAQVGLHVPWRSTLLALAGGEMAKTIPGGVLLQNYILARLGHIGEEPVVRSATATTAVLGLESAIALPVALIVGIPHQPWVSWTLLGFVLGWLVLLGLLWLLVHFWEVHLAPGTPRWLRRALIIVEEFLDAGGELLTWRTVRAMIPTAAYLLIFVAELDVLAAAVGIHTVNFVQLMSIYALLVLTGILVPIPVKIGTTEVTGLTAFVTYGVPAPTAAAIMLALRLLTTGMTILVGGLILFVLRDEFKRPHPVEVELPSTPTDHADSSW